MLVMPIQSIIDHWHILLTTHTFSCINYQPVHQTTTLQGVKLTWLWYQVFPKHLASTRAMSRIPACTSNTDTVWTSKSPTTAGQLLLAAGLLLTGYDESLWQVATETEVELQTVVDEAQSSWPVSTHCCSTVLQVVQLMPILHESVVKISSPPEDNAHFFTDACNALIGSLRLYMVMLLLICH